MDLHTILNTDFDRKTLAPEDFPRDARIRVTTFDHEKGELVFKARVIRPSSQSHLRIRTDDGLIFAVPAGDCQLMAEGD